MAMVKLLTQAQEMAYLLGQKAETLVRPRCRQSRQEKCVMGISKARCDTKLTLTGSLRTNL